MTKIRTWGIITVSWPKRIRSREKTFPAMKEYVNFIHALCNYFLILEILIGTRKMLTYFKNIGWSRISGSWEFGLEKNIWLSSIQRHLQRILRANCRHFVVLKRFCLILTAYFHVWFRYMFWLTGIKISPWQVTELEFKLNRCQETRRCIVKEICRLLGPGLNKVRI